MRHANARAFTLLEMLCALALSAFLLVALLGLVGRLTQRARQLEAVDSQPAWHSRLQSLVLDDLHNCSQYEHRADRLTLVTCPARDATTGRPAWRPAEITYAVQQVAGTPWLLRRERLLDDPDDRPPQVEWVAGGISAIEMQLASNERSEIMHGGMPPMRLRVRFQTISGLPCELDYCR